VGVVAVAGAAAFVALDRLTAHPGETVLLLMPPGLGALLWWGWPRVRRVPVWRYGVYLAVMVPVIAGAEWLAASTARGRVKPVEVFWALWFVVAWRLAWAVWARTVGRIGKVRQRWVRRRTAEAASRPPPVTGRRAVPRRTRVLVALAGPLRAGLAVFVFAPLMFGSLIHRFKIGNPPDKAGYADLGVEAVSFRTADGLRISGWFVPEPGSDATAIICHGAGANKGNFAAFLSLFAGRGYNSLIFDFRGHGDSDGHTVTFGLYEDADVRAAVDWLKRERPDRARHVVGIGSSMGAMALVRAAADDDRIEAVVLDSCFVSAPRLAEQHLGGVPVVGRPLGTLILASMSLHARRSFWTLDASEAIGRLSGRPVLLIHGLDDMMIPPANTEALYALAAEPKDKWLAPGAHSNVLTDDFDEYQERVLALFDGATATTRR